MYCTNYKIVACTA